MRVLVLWADGRSANLGVRVLAQGAESLARRVFAPDVEVVFQDLGPNEAGFRVSMDVVKRDVGRPRGPLKQWLRQFDVVLDTGAGDSFTDIYGRNRLGRIAYTQLTARRLGIPVVMLPQTIGPFTGRLNSAVARRALHRASVVMSRDAVSTAHAGELGRSHVVSATDLVFSLPRVEPEVSRDIVLNVSGLLWGDNAHVDPAVYRQSVRELVASLQERGRTVALLPHVLQNSTHDNDMIPIEELASQNSDLEVVVPDSLHDARTIVAGAQWVIGSRMHACLNALSVGTPAIPWAYSRKFQPLLEDIGWDYTVDLRSTPEPVAITLEHLEARDGASIALSESLTAAEVKNEAAVTALKALLGRA